MSTNDPTTCEWTVRSAAGPVTFTGQLLGRGSTESDRHRDHDRGGFAPRGRRCSACRWFTCEIFKTSGRYLVHTRGDTLVPGEDVIARVTYSTNAEGVLGLLVQRQPLSRPDPHNRDTWTWTEPRLSRSARVALETAALYDGDIRRVLAEYNAASVAPIPRT